MAQLLTTLGPKQASELGMILPHEHIYVDMQALQRDREVTVEASAVVALMGPEVKQAQARGVTALVDCTPVGVGRRVDLVQAVSQATGMPIAVPTGIYREPWIPQWARDASEGAIAEWMLSELQGEIERTGIPAAWIKLGSTDDGLTPTEIKLVRAAAIAGAQTNAVIGSHTRLGRVALEQIAIVEAAGYTAQRFIWIHTQNEEDPHLHLEAARRGAWIEYDAIGSSHPDSVVIEWITAALEAGFGRQVLLSHDRGWYDPAKPGGGTPRPFTYISDTFLPALQSAGVDVAAIHMLTVENPFSAFAR